MMKKTFIQLILIAILAVGTLTACSGDPDIQENQTAAAVDNNDPIEPFNRAIFAFNQGLDTVLIKPIAQGYRWIFPDPVRNSIRNFLDNLRSPVIFFNELFQANFTNAGETVARFVVNSTVGILGLFDVAESMGLERHNEDFGQTLGVWGAGEGFYLVLPVLGPSSARDAVGKVVDIFLDPLTYIANDTDNMWYLYTRAIVDGIDTRSRRIETLDQLKNDSVDFYASLRSVYRQHRASEITNGDVGTGEPDDPYAVQNY